MKKALSVIVILFLLAGFMPSVASAQDNKQNTEKAILAGGCFWCMESDFEKIPGVLDVVSGYAGGDGENPTYKDYGAKGHIEVVEVTFDPSIIPYKNLLDVFWHKIDPTDAGGQFCDRGHEYASAIFFLSSEQKRLAEDSKAAFEKSGRFEKPVVTTIINAGPFTSAEEYHQDYYKKNALKYKVYRFGCGRDNRLKELWGEGLDKEGQPRHSSD